MKQSNRCELCGKVYRYPQSISEYDLRYRVCSGCDVATQKMMKDPEKWIERYEEIKEEAFND